MSSAAVKPSSPEHPDRAPPVGGPEIAYATEFDRRTATFRNRDLERSYREHLATYGFGHEFRLQLIAIGVFLSYGLLDFLVVGDLRHDFLSLRFLIVAPIVGFFVFVTSMPKMRRYVEYSTTFGFGAFAAAIIYMIYRMPPDGAPPYIIGLLVVMIFTSCLMRISFVIAACTYFTIGTAYCLTLVLREGVSAEEMISGLFFMISVAGVATITIYAEEIRSRQIWFRNEQRRADAARIKQLLIDATAADQSKLNFLSVLTHELRTPLHQIIGFGEVLKSDAVGVDSRMSAVDNIIDPAKDLLKKLGQMLRYADATAGRLTFQFDDISIREVVETVKDQLSEHAARKGVSIDISEVRDHILHVDQHHAMYALTCLVENALTASPPGSVISISGRNQSEGLYRLEISDTGCGMTDEQIATAFSAFEQNQSALSRSNQGLGLGLTIANRLLTEQRADLRLESRPGVGTRATVDFRFERAPQIGAREPEAVSRIA